jgi:hypothetical protein
MNETSNTVVTAASGCIPDFSLPVGVQAVVILGAGWLLALLLRRVVTFCLEWRYFHGLWERKGVVDVLRKGNINHTPARVIGVAVYWIVLIVTALFATRLAGAKGWEPLRERIVAFLPAIVAAIAILIVGYAVVSFLANVAQTLAQNAGSSYGAFFRKCVRVAGTVLIVIFSLEQLGMMTGIIGLFLHVLLAATAFGLALAFGLGCKDLARQATEKFLRDMREKHRKPSGNDLEG